MIIKNCPHCGGAASLYRYFDWGNRPLEDEGKYYVMVRCDVCGAAGAQKEMSVDDWEDWERLEKTPAAKDSITAWNLRCLSDDVETLIDKRIAAALARSQDAAGDAENAAERAKGQQDNKTPAAK